MPTKLHPLLLLCEPRWTSSTSALRPLSRSCRHRRMPSSSCQWNHIAAARMPTLKRTMTSPSPDPGVLQTRNSACTPLLTALLEGPAGAGKTAIAATLGIDSQFPFVKVVTAENMVGWSETAKAGQIAKVFEDSYKARSPG